LPFGVDGTVVISGGNREGVRHRVPPSLWRGPCGRVCIEASTSPTPCLSPSIGATPRQRLACAAPTRHAWCDGRQVG
jgi:hypothetical protein